MAGRRNIARPDETPGLRTTQCWDGFDQILFHSTYGEYAQWQYRYTPKLEGLFVDGNYLTIFFLHILDLIRMFINFLNLMTLYF